MDREKEERIVGQFKNRIYYFALREVHDRDAAFDITQDTVLSFLEVYRAGNVKNPDNLPGLAYGIFRNKLAGYFKKAGNRQQALLSSGGSEAAASEDAVERMIRKSQEEQIQRNVRKLKSLDRQILLLSFHENRSCQEIAELMQLDSHYVSVRKWRALKKLRKWMR